MQKATIERIESFMLQEIKYKNVQMYQLYKLLLWIDIMIAPVANCHSVLLGVSPMLPSMEASQRDIYWNYLKLALPAACRYSESLPASLHPSPAPMAPITMAICDYIWQFVTSHVAIRDKTNNCAFLGGPCCMWPGAYRHLTWQMQLVSCNLHRSV